MRTIPVHLGGNDVAALDTLTASRQGLVVVLLDGRVLLVPLTLADAQVTVAAWARGALEEMQIRPPYTLFHRMTVH